MSGPSPVPRTIPLWIQICVHGTQEGSQRVNCFSYKWTGSATSPTSIVLFNMATSWWTAVGTLYRAMCTGALNIDYITARWLDPGGPPVLGTVTLTPPTPGTAAGVSTPGNAACVISWRTGFVGRAYRGRTYLPAISEAQQTNSTVNSAYLTNANALANAISTFTNGAGTVGVLSVVASVVKQQLNQTLGFVIDNAIDNQRRRLLNRGR